MAKADHIYLRFESQKGFLEGSEAAGKSKESNLNEDDLNLIRKYKPQIDEAAKKFKTK